MPTAAVPAAESVASLVLAMLLRRRRVSVPTREVLISAPQPASVVRLLTAASQRATPRDLVASPHSTPPRTAAAAKLLAGLPGFGGAAAPDMHHAEFVVLAHEDGPALLANSCAVCVPLSLVDVAQMHRARHRAQRPTAATSSTAHAPVALLECGGTAATQAVARQSFDLYCSPASKELVVVDVPANATGDAVLWDGVLVAESVLKADGTLILTSRHPFSAQVQRFLKWRFHRSHCGVGAAHFAVCSSVAADFGDVAVGRRDFPGFFAASTPRPRKWNPYRRAQEKKFVASVRPGFTNASLTKDSLQRSVAREKEADERLRDADDAFFAVAHEMVATGAHYTHPHD